MDVIGEFFKSALFSIIAIFDVNSGTDEPPYRVIQAIDPQTEVRHYEPRLAAEITLTITDGKKPERIAFGKLASYIFGDNALKTKMDMTAPVEKSTPDQKTKIAMTAPVDMKKDAQTLTMRFFMPAQYTLDNLPQPTDPDIKIIVIPAQTLAVRKYSGSTDEGKVASEQKQLATTLASTSWKVTDSFRSYFYNPPWTLPPLRRNEILVPVAQ